MGNPHRPKPDLQNVLSSQPKTEQESALPRHGEAMSRAMRPKKGELFVKINDGKYEVAVLIEKDKIRDHHRAAIDRLLQILTFDLLKAPTDAQVEKGCAPDTEKAE
jgi:hypothetical protein